LRLTVSEAATITVLIKGRVAGRKVHGHCKPSAKKGKRCTVPAKHVTLTFHAKSGANTFAFQPRLKPGKYSTTVTARDSGGRQSKAVTLRFSVR
jgi:hypothetical protein